MPSKISPGPCLWKKVLLNPASTSSLEANPVQKHLCQKCQCDPQNLNCICDKYIKTAK